MAPPVAASLILIALLRFHRHYTKTRRVSRLALSGIVIVIYFFPLVFIVNDSLRLAKYLHSPFSFDERWAASLITLIAFGLSLELLRSQPWNLKGVVLSLCAALSIAMSFWAQIPLMTITLLGLSLITVKWGYEYLKIKSHIM